MKTKYYYGKPKDNRRIFSSEPTWRENALDCAAFLVAIVFIYAVAAYWGA